MTAHIIGFAVSGEQKIHCEGRERRIGNASTGRAAALPRPGAAPGASGYLLRRMRRRRLRMKVLNMCLNWKVFAGLAAVGVGIYVVAPNLAAAALPFLILAICPLLMLLIMRSMQDVRSETQEEREEPQPAKNDREDRAPRGRTRTPESRT
jgi:hypothetical protein